MIHGENTIIIFYVSTSTQTTSIFKYSIYDIYYYYEMLPLEIGEYMHNYVSFMII